MINKVTRITNISVVISFFLISGATFAGTGEPACCKKLNAASINNDWLIEGDRIRDKWIKKDQENYKNEIDNHVATIENDTKRINSAENSISQLNDLTEAHSAWIEAEKVRGNKTADELNNHKAAIEINTERINSAENSISQLNDSTEAHSAWIEAEKVRGNKAVIKINENENAIKNNEERIENVKKEAQDFASHQSVITEKKANQYTDSKVNENNEVIISNAKQEAIESVNNVVVNVENNAKNYTNDRANQAEKNANQYTEKHISNISSRTDTLSAAVSKEEKERTDGDRKTLSMSHAYTDTQLIHFSHNNNKKLNQIDSRLNHLDGRIDDIDHEMKRGFASQAALTGLFQPYNVGKFNFTAAVGGYDSETAVAVGSGYRFSEDIAVKAGVATNTGNFSGTAYNVGVNFEW